MSKEKLTGAELVNPYDDGKSKGEQVERMFDSIAPAYDFMNTAMTFGLHRRWRNKAISKATAARLPRDYFRALDIATGTGDVAFELHRRFPNAQITGIDLSNGMLDIARKKLKEADKSAREEHYPLLKKGKEFGLVEFEQGDSLRMRFDDNSFDLVTVAYGVRNFEHLELGLREMHRVLKPGGTLCIIELSEPERGLLHAGYRLYARHIIPAIGRCVSGDSRAYTYLPESIAAAPQRDALTAIMERAGFRDCRWKSLTFGAVTYYIANK